MKKSQRKNVLLAGQDHYNKSAGMEFHQISQILPSNLHVHCFCIVPKKTNKHVFYLFQTAFSHIKHTRKQCETQKNVLEPLSPNRSKTHLKETKSKEPTQTIQMAWFASKGTKYYIRLTAKTISCSAACENSYSFNCRRVRSHRKHPARLRFTPAPSTTRPVIISQTGILALLRLCLMYFLIPIAFPSSSFFPSTWHKRGERKSRVAASRDCGAIARETNKPRLDDDGGAVSHGSSSEVAATADCDRVRRQDEGRRDKGRLQMTRRVASAAESAAAEVRWLSEVQERNSHPAAGRKHHGKPDELVLSNPCRDTRSRSLSLTLALTLALVCSFSKRSLGGVLPRIRALFISASAALLNL